MPDNIISVGVLVSDNGSGKKTQQNVQGVANAINDVEQKAQRASKALQSISVPGPGAGAKASAGIPTGGSGGNKPPKNNKQESDEYDSFRGAQGTGASARDFANQSRGLGGLVRLYATVAANTFAAEAAFRALSKAYDTSNLVKGLDQLGAATGRNLSGLAKQLQISAEGGISLRDSLEAVTKASSAGLDNQQILRLGEAAKRTSQALGVDLSDAYSRLSRGISKIEPELLDELGIFVRVDEVNRKYAASLGKSALALTDFEKRQAFANAVLTQAEKKFGEIELDVNPYTKLAAAITNTTQSGLELVNKVLGPLAKLLSESPTALTGVLAAIGVSLIKTAIPAITEYRKNLLEAAEESKQKSAETAALAKSLLNNELAARQEVFEKRKKLDLAASQAELDQAKSLVEKKKAIIQESRNKIALTVNQAFKDKSLPTYTLLTKDPETLTQEDLAKANKAAAAAENLRNTEQANRIRVVIGEVARLKNLQEELGKVNDTYNQKHNKYLEEETQLTNRLNKDLATRTGLFSDLNTQQRIALRDAQTYAKLSAVANAASNQEILGTAGAWRVLRAEVAQAGKPLAQGGQALGTISKAATIAQGGLAIVTTKATGLLNAFGVYGAIAAGVVAALGLLDSALSSNAKEAAALDNSIDLLKSSAESANRALKEIFKNEDKEFLSAESLLARSNALQDLSTSLAKAADDYEDFKKSTKEGVYDVSKEGLKSFFGFGKDDDLAEAIVANVRSAINAIPEGPLREEFENQVKSILNIKDISSSAIEDAVEADAKRAGLVARAIADQQKIAAKPLEKAGSSVKNFTDSLAVADKSYQALINSLKDNSLFTKLGEDFIQTGLKLEKAFDTPITALEALNKTLNDGKSLALFSEQTRSDLLQNSADIENVTDKYSKLRKELVLAKQEQEEFSNGINNRSIPQQELDRLKKEAQSRGYSKEEFYNLIKDNVLTKEQELINKVKSIEQSISANDAKILGLAAKFRSAFTEQISRGLDLVDRSLSIAKAKAAIDLRRVQVSTISGVGTAAIETDLKRKEIQQQLTLIQATYALAKAQVDSTLAIEENTRQKKIESLSQSIGPSTPESQRVAVGKEIDSLRSLQKQTSDLRSIIAAGKLTRESIKEFTGEVQTVALNVYQAQVGFRTQQAELRGQDAVAVAQGAIQADKERFEERQKILEVEIRIAETAAQRARTLASINSLQDESLVLAAQGLELEANSKKDAKQRQDVQERLRTNKALLSGAFSDTTIQLLDKAASGDSTAQKGLDLYIATIRGKLSPQLEGIINNRRTLIREETALLDSQKASTKQLELSNAQELIKLKFAKDSVLEQEKLAKSQIEAQLKDQRLQAEEDLYNRRLELGVLSTAQAAAEIESIKLKQALSEKLTKEEQIRFDAAQKRSQAQLEFALQEKALSASGPADPLAIANITRIRDSQQASVNAQEAEQLKLATAIYDQKVKSIGLIGEEAKAYGNLRDVISTLSTVMEDFSNSFGTIGRNIAGALTAIVDFSSTQEKLIKVQQEETTSFNKLWKEKETIAYNTANSMEEVAIFQAAQEQERIKLTTKQEKERADLELTNNAKLAGSVSKLFNQKTTAAKLFASIEKAIHIQKLVQQTQAILMDKNSTLSAIVESGKRAYSYATEAIANAYAKIPAPYNFIVGAAVAAVMTSLLGKAFKGGGGGSFQMSSQQRQETQGTGQTYNARGEKVSTGLGVLGDSEAKADSITKSLSILENNSITGITDNDRIKTLLQNIRDNISKLAISLYSTFNSKINREKLGKLGELSGGLFDPNSSQGRAAGSALGATIGGIGGALIGGPAGSALAAIGAGIGAAIGKPIARLGQNLFGGRTTRDIKAQGIQLQGSFLEATAGNSGFEAFIDVETRRRAGLVSSLFGGSDKFSTETFKEELDSSANNLLTSILKDTKEVLTITASKFGITAEQVTRSLGTLTKEKLKELGLDRLDLTGMKSEETEAAIRSYLSNLDSAAIQTIKPLQDIVDKYAQGGEEGRTTLTRVLNTNTNVSRALSETSGTSLDSVLRGIITPGASSARSGIGSIFGGASKLSEFLRNLFGQGLVKPIGDLEPLLEDRLKPVEQRLRNASIAVTESLATLAGSQDKFLELNQGFQDKFFTDEQKAAVNKSRLSEALANIEDETTRNQIVSRQSYIEAVQEAGKAENLITEAGRKRYVDLLEIQDLVDVVYKKEVEQKKAGAALSEEDSKLLSLNIQKLRLQGKASEALALERAEELRQYEKFPAEVQKKLVATQLEVYALQDAAKISQMNTRLLKAEGRAYEALLQDRQRELDSLTDEEKLIAKKIFAQEDANKTQDLEIQLLEALGMESEALAIKREREYLALSASDAALLRRINQLQDAKKLEEERAGLEIKISQLLGDSSKALALTRKKELAAVDKSLIPLQEYVYAIEDETEARTKLAEARDREMGALQSTLDTISNYIDSLDSYKASLLDSNKSIETPQQKYQRAKAEAEKLYAIINSAAVTEADKAKRNDAISKLPQISDAFLDASRQVYASGEQYNKDLAKVMDIIDSTGASLAGQKSATEQQLDQLKSSTSFLDAINQNTRSTSELLKDYLAAQEKRIGLESKLPISATSTTITSLQAPILNMPAPIDNANTQLVTNLNSTLVTLTSEMAAIKEALDKARQEAQSNTGTEVQANAVVTNNLAARIENAINALASDPNWRLRTTPVLT